MKMLQIKYQFFFPPWYRCFLSLREPLAVEFDAGDIAAAVAAVVDVVLVNSHSSLGVQDWQIDLLYCPPR